MKGKHLIGTQSTQAKSHVLYDWRAPQPWSRISTLLSIVTLPRFDNRSPQDDSSKVGEAQRKSLNAAISGPPAS